jgi:NAD+ synthase (glutamine-hydrolysing)
MGKHIRIAIAQINLTVGDIDGNVKKMEEYVQKARTLAADIVVFPELAIPGYPPEDLLHKERFVDDNIAALKKFAKSAEDILVVAGFADKRAGDIFNSAAVIYKGHVKGIYDKVFLPNYGVFDERRYFKPGQEASVFRAGDMTFGVNICEDIWHKGGPTKAQAASGARLIININASPYYAGKTREREDVVKERAKDSGAFIVYANLVGGQDELVFDGQSMVVDNAGKVLCRAEAFKEELLVADIELPENGLKAAAKAIVVADKMETRTKPSAVKKDAKPLEPVAEVYQALTAGLKDYVAKNGFKKVAIGLSGGIDSALVAAIAVDALGKENVSGVFMPTRYSSEDSEIDAKALAANLGINFMDISIEHIFKIYLMTLEPHFAGKERDITEENIQARIRGNIMMALSNKFGWLVLTTGNKSEMSTGYATLYGDMAGGFAVIKDVPKTLVYKLAKYRNGISKVIPDRIITKAPTAELRPDQKDQDTLPPYETLDAILKAYIEEDRDLKEIVAMGFNKETVLKVSNMVDKSEYKRRQSPPGIKITPKAFGRDRRMPITNKYKQ